MGIDCPPPFDRKTVFVGNVELAHYRHTPIPYPSLWWSGLIGPAWMRPQEFTFLFSSFDLWPECTWGSGLAGFPSLGPRLDCDSINCFDCTQESAGLAKLHYWCSSRRRMQVWRHWPMTDVESRCVYAYVFLPFTARFIGCCYCDSFFMWRSLSRWFWFANFPLSLILKCALLGQGCQPHTLLTATLGIT